ncbi:hypothetical protein ACFO6R_06480 [Eubacterium multiforme]|uniref:ABC-type transport system substrate-binding protein n=1 Tax=Eubacterium multiforme TaxID=83339 RepID=A0ABT9USE6_9FIRM|nr:hypothetical protein [Eubacterium multiforme]MDQ0149240.1 ABC-type transport system substrate-binding protein [Eubacterium multiforme]
MEKKEFQEGLLAILRGETGNMDEERKVAPILIKEAEEVGVNLELNIIDNEEIVIAKIDNKYQFKIFKVNIKTNRLFKDNTIDGLTKAFRETILDRFKKVKQDEHRSNRENK